MIEATIVLEAIRSLPAPEGHADSVRRLIARHPGVGTLLDFELRGLSPGHAVRFELLALAIVGAFERVWRLAPLSDGEVAAAALSVERDVAAARHGGDLSRFARDFASQTELFNGIASLHRALFAEEPECEAAGRAFWFLHSLTRACALAAPAPLPA